MNKRSLPPEDRGDAKVSKRVDGKLVTLYTSGTIIVLDAGQEAPNTKEALRQIASNSNGKLPMWDGKMNTRTYGKLILTLI